MKKADLFFNVLRLPVDYAMILASGIVTYVFRTQILGTFRPVLFRVNLPLQHYIILVVLTAGVFVIAYAIAGLYGMRTRMSIAEEFFKILVGSSAGILAVIIYIFLSQSLFNSRFLVLGGWFFAIIFVFSGRLAIRVLRTYLVSRSDFGIHKAMIIGNDVLSEKIVRALEKDRASGYRIVKYLPNPEVGEVKVAVGNPGVDEVILTNPHYPAAHVMELVDFCHENHIIFKFIPNIYETLTTNFDVDAIAGIPVIELKRTTLDGWGQVLKRVFDIGAASVAMLVLAPIVAIIALAIKWETAGPVLVRLKRVSKNREFYLYKFRSMIENAESLKPYLTALNERADGPLFKITNDPRITSVGQLLRQYRLDELPQFINIFKGDISLVGPRPHQPDEIARYEHHHKKVLAIKAGATGLAQVSGSSALPFEEEVILDTFYVEHWSLWLDMKVMIKTALKMFRDRSAV